MSEKFDEIWAILQSITEQQKANDARLAKKFAEVAEQQAEVAEQQKAMDRKFEEVTKKFAEVAEQQKITDAQLRKTDAQLKRISKRIGGMANNDGIVVEEFFWYSLKKKKELNGIPIHYSTKNLVVRDEQNQTKDEYDTLLFNANSVIIVETKWKVRPNDIEKFRDKKIPNFKRYFPRGNEYHIYGAIAGYSIPDEVAKEVKENGFFVLRQSGENLLVESDELKVY